MLHFEDGFFDEEIKCDFRISAAMKCAWAAQLEVLDRVDRICRKHGIRYFAFWGTLLGAVRHQGFIPWDDDIDIGMPRDDYEKFITYARKELQSPYELKTFDTDENYQQYIIRIINNQVEISRNDALTNRNDNIWIDIFPLDGMPNNFVIRAIHKFHLLFFDYYYSIQNLILV